MIKRLLGIDYGHVRIGLALGDSETKLARPISGLVKSDDPTAALREVVDRESVDELVVGLPRGLDGQETIQTEAVRLFASKLRSLGRPVHLTDEAATSSVAEERLKASGRSYSKDTIDSEAAALILQDFLDQS